MRQIGTGEEHCEQLHILRGRMEGSVGIVGPQVVCVGGITPPLIIHNQRTGVVDCELDVAQSMKCEYASAITRNMRCQIYALVMLKTGIPRR
jgi:hypothetical protein